MYIHVQILKWAVLYMFRHCACYRHVYKQTRCYVLALVLSIHRTGACFDAHGNIDFGLYSTHIHGQGIAYLCLTNSVVTSVTEVTFLSPLSRITDGLSRTLAEGCASCPVRTHSILEVGGCLLCRIALVVICTITLVKQHWIFVSSVGAHMNRQ